MEIDRKNASPRTKAGSEKVRGEFGWGVSPLLSPKKR